MKMTLKKAMKKLNSYQKALEQIANIDDNELVKKEKRKGNECLSAYALGVAQAIAEMALEDMFE